MLIETDRICLRRWTDSDRAPFAKMNRNPNVMRFLGPLMTPQDSGAAIDKQIALMEKGEPAFWAVEQKKDGSFIGCIGVKRVTFDAPFAPCFEIGWRLGEAYWGQGYATEGAKAALKLAFSQWGMKDIYSFTVPKNTQSQSVMIKIGMERVSGGDFDHPTLKIDDPLCRHVLYRIDSAKILAAQR